MHPREIELRAFEAMEGEVLEAGSGIPPLIKQRTAENLAVLRYVALRVAGDISRQLAMTDPSRYRKLARLRTEIILRGYHDYFQKLAAKCSMPPSHGLNREEWTEKLSILGVMALR